MENKEMSEYVHYELNQEYTAIGGHYITTKEVRLPYEDKEILYTVGIGVIDTSCCGVGGCGFATVYGYITNWKYRENGDGLPVTKVEPISDDSIRKKINDQIYKSEVVQQVNHIVL